MFLPGYFFVIYIVGPNETQVTFMGQEQHQGVHMVPFAVPDTFKLQYEPPASTADGDSPAGVPDSDTSATVTQTGRLGAVPRQERLSGW